MRLRLAVGGALVLAFGCSGGSCSWLNHEPPPSPAPKASVKPPPKPLVRLREFLFPDRSCTTTLRRALDGAHEIIDYELSHDAAGHEVIKMIRRGPQPGSMATATWDVDETGIRLVSSEGKQTPPSYPKEAHELDLLTKRQRLVGTHDTAPGPGGELQPCVTALSRRDVDKIFRIYETWCKGFGLARTDESRGRARLIEEVESSTCR